MNSSRENITKEIILKFINTDKFLTRIGSILWVEVIHLFIITPIAAIGIILNTLIIFILFKINDNKYFIFKILKVYCFNSLIMCVMGVFSFYVGSPRYIGFRIDYFAKVYYCIILQYTENTLYYCSNILDIIINIERSSIFIPKFESIRKLNPLATYFLLLILCHIVNAPTLLRSWIKNEEETYIQLIDTYVNMSFYPRCNQGPLFGNYPFLIMTTVLRDIFTLILEIVFTSLTLYYFVRFQTTKALLLNKKHSNSNANSNKIEESRMTFMSLFLTITSIISHLAVFLASISLVIYTSAPAVTILIMVSVLSVSFKHTSNFFILYFFNKRFHSTLNDYFNGEQRPKPNPQLKTTTRRVKTVTFKI